MKKPKDVNDLAARLTAGATTPLQVVAPPVIPAPVPSAEPEGEKLEPETIQQNTAKRGSVSVFLRLPPALHARLANIATERTRAIGKGVTVQQIILEHLEQAL